jgi:hypothetical protein
MAMILALKPLDMVCLDIWGFISLPRSMSGPESNLSEELTPPKHGTLPCYNFSEDCCFLPAK